MIRAQLRLQLQLLVLASFTLLLSRNHAAPLHSSSNGGAESESSSLWDCGGKEHEATDWREAVPEEAPYVYFVHLRKSGGSTVEYMLLREAARTRYVQQLRDTGREKPEPGAFHIFRWFQSNQIGKIGHYNMSQEHHLNRKYKARRPVYITVLRHPVARVVSAYWFSHRFWRYKDIVAYPNGTSKMSLADFVRLGHADNDHQFFATRAKGDETVDDAKRTLSERYLFVGVVEHFDESMVLLHRALGIDTHYEHRNAGTYQKGGDDGDVDGGGRGERGGDNGSDFQTSSTTTTSSHGVVTEEEERIILEHNQRDLELWKHAKHLVEAQIDCYGREEFRHDLTRWRQEQLLQQKVVAPKIPTTTPRLRRRTQ